MGNKAGKIWGQTELIEANGSCEFHRIDFVKGGTCSKHKHEYKWNGFYVMSGEMKIRVWQKDYDLVDETILKAGDYTAVKPGLYHSFEGLQDGCRMHASCIISEYQLPRRLAAWNSDLLIAPC